MNNMHLTIAYNKQVHVIDIDPLSVTVEQVQIRIEQLTNVPVHSQKLVCAKCDFSRSHVLVSDTGLQDYAKIMVLAKAAVSEIQQLNLTGEKQASILRNRLEFIEKYRVEPTKDKRNASADLYTFQHIQALEQFSDNEKAIEILERFRDDSGIQHIMEKYKWNVSVLKEIHPNHESTILGYNQNKGQAIALLLRTDDLKGFRAYDMVKKVLIHELAHM